jgi:hypothetical protein
VGHIVHKTDCMGRGKEEIAWIDEWRWQGMASQAVYRPRRFRVESASEAADMLQRAMYHLVQ